MDDAKSATMPSRAGGQTRIEELDDTLRASQRLYSQSGRSAP
jgi:hypothetical protein